MTNEFLPADSKLEAVARISKLTGSGPETLGPGSKERKAVLVNLARGLMLDVDEGLSKPALGEAIARQLGAYWDEACWSRGSTVTLEGLNRLLRFGECHPRAGSAAADPGTTATWTPLLEAEAILRALTPVISARWEGRHCILEMRDAEYNNWAQDKWAGWYFEFVALPRLINELGGGPRKYLNTSFDYALRSTWDLKAHSEQASNTTAILNDQQAMRSALRSGGGLGFVLLNGKRIDDGGEFRRWQRVQRLQACKKRRSSSPESDDARPVVKGLSSPAFEPTLIEFFHLRDERALDLALESGAIRSYAQRPQTGGAPRKAKFELVLRAARRDLKLTEMALDESSSTVQEGATLCRLEYLTPNGWVVGHTGIRLLSPARYVERLTARGKFGRCTEIRWDGTDGAMCVSPGLPIDPTALVPDPPFRIPKAPPRGR